MIPQKASVLFSKNYYGNDHVTINQGGTSSGKTYAIMQVLFCLGCEAGKLVITVVGQDIPNLKAGALRDAQNIYYSWSQLQAMIKSYNKTDRIFEFYNGTIIEFKSYDNAQDAKSSKDCKEKAPQISLSGFRDPAGMENYLFRYFVSN